LKGYPSRIATTPNSTAPVTRAATENPPAIASSRSPIAPLLPLEKIPVNPHRLDQFYERERVGHRSLLLGCCSATAPLRLPFSLSRRQRIWNRAFRLFHTAGAAQYRRVTFEEKT